MSDSVGWARRAGGPLLAALVALAGCQGGKTPATVSGTVTYKGEALKSGFVNFYIPEKGLGAQGEIDASGTYRLQGTIEPGTYKVYIQRPLPEQLPPGQVSKRAPFPVPDKYQDAGTTPITKEVKGGQNDIPIELTD